MTESILWFKQLGLGDVERVGGKNASLGEMIAHLSARGVRVPDGFATTADAYRAFLQHEGLHRRINEALAALDVDDVAALRHTGEQIRAWLMDAPFPAALRRGVEQAYAEMTARQTMAMNGQNGGLTVAVRSSATAEDLPDASFAGQQETFLNITGIDNVLIAIKRVFASLYNDRAIAYRAHQGFRHDKVALSAGVQRMARSDLGAGGVMFTLDTESGFRDVVLITGAYGLGETVVQGAVNPDEFYVYKPALQKRRPAVLSRALGGKAVKMVYADSAAPGRSVKTVEVEHEARRRFCLTDAQIEELARYALAIEAHYRRPMDIEWALDGGDNRLYIVQARPETVESRTDANVIERYVLEQTAKDTGRVLAQGRAIGQKIGAGRAKVVMSPEAMAQVGAGDVLVTDMTDPDWEPIMKRAAAIVTNRGGRTCHAAIIARELGIPAIVGCGDATRAVAEGQAVTVSCAEGDTGRVYHGTLAFEVKRADTGAMPEIPVNIMLNVANPGRAFAFSRLPNKGVGLARLEFIINSMIGVHPKALLEFERQAPQLQEAIQQRMAGYHDPVGFYVDKLTEGIATLAAAFAPAPVIARLSDFKSNEYANLLGGEAFEPREENPMLGFRGVSRYLADSFRDCFELECRAVKRVRDEMGLTNLELMVPFCRTLAEAAAVIRLLEDNGLKRGENNLRVMMMCELPSNAMLADRFLEFFDGFSIGSNDMTQLALGLDRDSALIADKFDERDAAVKKLLGMAISACRAQGKYVGICGQGPSDYPEFAQWLLEQGIDSISLNPDTVVDTWLHLAGRGAGKA